MALSLIHRSSIAGIKRIPFRLAAPPDSEDAVLSSLGAAKRNSIRLIPAILIGERANASTFNDLQLIIRRTRSKEGQRVPYLDRGHLWGTMAGLVSKQALKRFIVFRITVLRLVLPCYIRMAKASQDLSQVLH